jgi:two-component system response regulator HydG
MQSEAEAPIVPLALLEKIMILRAMKRHPNKRDAAKVLGIGKTTLYRKLSEYAQAQKMSKP